jgi:molecular chaperone GrpE
MTDPRSNDAQAMPAPDEAPAGPAGETVEPAASDVAERAAGEAVEDDSAASRVAEPDVHAALAAAEQQRDDYLDHLRRERAEFENYRRRMTRERMDALDRGAEQLMANLLGVLDNFGLALEAAEKSEDEQLSKGVRMVHAQMLDVLRKAGLADVPGVGEPFNPKWHEALFQVDAEEPVDHPVVVDVLRPGYRFKGRVLRPASVKVAS